MTDRKNQNPDDLERNIEESQDTLRRDMDALGEKMNPENVAHETGERVREGLTESARKAGDAVRGTLDDTFQRFDERDDWASWGLVGTVALIGLGFILMRGAAQREEMDRGHSEAGRLEYGREYGRGGDAWTRTEHEREEAGETSRPSPMEG